jgi:hypothetical protein
VGWEFEKLNRESGSKFRIANTAFQRPHPSTIMRIVKMEEPKKNNIKNKKEEIA